MLRGVGPRHAPVGARRTSPTGRVGHQGAGKGVQRHPITAEVDAMAEPVSARHVGGDPASTRTADRDGGSAVRGGLAMLALAIVLSWLPIIGPAVAGYVGGGIIGRAGKAVAVALIPAVVLAVVTGLLLTAVELPVIGALAGVGIAIAIAVEQLPLLIGAWVGGRSVAR